MKTGLRIGRGKEELHSRLGEQHKQTLGAWNKKKTSHPEHTHAKGMH